MSRNEGSESPSDAPIKQLEGIIYDLLLKSDGRTTDLLETLMNEKMGVSVLRQGPADGASQRTETEVRRLDGGDARDIVRESVLIGAGSRIVVSHNIALIHAGHVPPALLERIAHGQEGIGKSIGSIGVESLRKIVDYGKVAIEDALDLQGQPVKLQFAGRCDFVYYKKYVIYFGLLPGIQLLEYFNPGLVEHRLRQSPVAE